MELVDAVVIGAGHHGLVSAALLADAGWDVLVVEERDRVGGAVASRNSGGWVEDEFSACHPLAVASPVLRELDLESYGLRWERAPRPLAHVSGQGEGGVPLLADPAATAAELEREHPGDGDEWLQMCAQWQRVRDPLVGALLTRWPPVGDLVRLLGRLGVREAPDLARLAVLPVAQLARERFGGRGAGQLLAGNAMHADIPPTAAGSGLYGWLMTMLCQDVGFPAPRGGSGQLAEALRRRAEAAGARVELGVAARRVVVGGQRVHGVELADGRRVRARRAVVADTSAPRLYGELLDHEQVPPGLRPRPSGCTPTSREALATTLRRSSGSSPAARRSWTRWPPGGRPTRSVAGSSPPPTSRPPMPISVRARSGEAPSNSSSRRSGGR